jgi:hypothetical protein
MPEPTNGDQKHEIEKFIKKYRSNPQIETVIVIGGKESCEIKVEIYIS